MTRSEGSGLSGVLVVDKPAGPTSHDVVASVRRLLQERRVGHAGTLDPFATGVLACAVGSATRLVRFLAGCDKTYEGLIAFGFATDTGDRTGAPLAPAAAPRFGEAELLAAVLRLSGELLQVPPMYSAKKRDGVSLHVLARKGQEVEREAVPVRVKDWSLDGPREDGTVRFRVTCSAGTYVRVLAADLGELLGCPAHLAELRRVSAGPFVVEQAVQLDTLSREAALSALIPLDRVPLPLPQQVLADESEERSFAHGRVVRGDGSVPAGSECAVRAPDGRLAGVARALEGGLLQPDVVLLGAPA